MRKLWYRIEYSFESQGRQIDLRFRGAQIHGWSEVLVYVNKALIWDGSYKGQVDEVSAELIAYRALENPYNYMEGERPIPVTF